MIWEHDFACLFEKAVAIGRGHTRLVSSLQAGRLAVTFCKSALHYVIKKKKVDRTLLKIFEIFLVRFLL